LSTHIAFLSNIPNVRKLTWDNSKLMLERQCLVSQMRAILRRGGSIPKPNPNDPQKGLLLTVPFFHVVCLVLLDDNHQLTSVDRDECASGNWHFSSLSDFSGLV
jgi:hypothetical protein